MGILLSAIKEPQLKPFCFMRNVCPLLRRSFILALGNYEKMHFIFFFFLKREGAGRILLTRSEAD